MIAAGNCDVVRNAMTHATEKLAEAVDRAGLQVPLSRKVLSVLRWWRRALDCFANIHIPTLHDMGHTYHWGNQDHPILKRCQNAKVIRLVLTKLFA